MKNFLLSVCCIFTIIGCQKAEISDTNQDIVTSDIDNFWEAYDSITSTADTVKQHYYLKKLFLDKSTIGLETIMKVRRYKPYEYINAINSYPLYWNSVREKTLSAQTYAEEIQQGVDRFKALYPNHRPAKIYFEIGVFRTPGTALDSILLIGAEMAMGDENVNTSELPESMNYVKDYLKGNPVKDLSFLNVHEYVHSQQRTQGGYDLLSQSLFEGSAELIAQLATDQAPPTPAISYGQANDDKVKARFVKEMFVPWFYNWIWNNKNNEFGTRDLGYYIGWAISKKFYDSAPDKQQAIRDLIELDYNNRDTIEHFIESTGYFSKPLSDYRVVYEESRPEVTKIGPFKNGDQEVKSGLVTLSVEVSQPLDQYFKSTGYGDLGEDYFPEISSIETAENGKTITYQLKLAPGRRYQFYINNGFRTPDGIPLKPYLVDFKTSDL